MENTAIIKKIEKLLSLAGNNPSAKEAEAAMLKAQQLMAEHNISLSQVGEKDSQVKEVITEWIKGGQNCQWMRKLGNVVANNFRCTMMIGKGYGLVFVGLKEDVHICTQVFNFAANTLDNNMKKLRREYRRKGLSTDGISGDYSAGFIKGLSDKFQEQVERNNWGLILVKDEAVTEYVNKNRSSKAAGHGKAQTRRFDPTLFNKGYKDGKNLDSDRKCLN